MKIAVVTPTNDHAVFLKGAIESVPLDEGVEVEQLIVHDGSAAYLSWVEHEYPHVRVIRGEGNGSGAAAALGLRLAKADFLIQLNSDDRLVRGSFRQLALQAHAMPEVEIWSGGTRLFQFHEGGEERLLRVLASPAVTSLTVPNILDDLPQLSARFVRQEVFQKIGVQSPQFEDCNDRELLLRAIFAGIVEAPLQCMVSEVLVHPQSHSMGGDGKRVAAYLSAHLVLADYWLERGDLLPPRALGQIRNWRAREVLRLSFYQLSNCTSRDNIKRLFHEFRRMPSWPLRAMTIVPAMLRCRRSVPRDLVDR